MRSVLLFIVLLAVCSSLKILVYNPRFGVSHVTTMGRIADVLAEAGHEVVTLMPKIEEMRSDGTKLSRIIYVDRAESTAKWIKEKEKNFIGVAWSQKSANPLAMIGMWSEMVDAFTEQCEKTLTTPHLLEQLRSEKFDFALAEPMDLCSYTLFNVLGIDKYAVSLTTTITGSFTEQIGGANAPSYVPEMMSAYTDKMSFLQRVGNFMQSSIVKVFMKQFFAKQDTLNAKLGLSVPTASEQFALASLVFVNSDPLIEFPRPTLHKIIDIGGISVAPRNNNSLDENWNAILSKREKTVLVSFGSVALSHLMPDAYKESLKATFKKFPNVTFIWKYEKPQHNVAAGIDNVVTSTWVPQQQMLGDPRLSVFLTHGGMGSTNEAINRGVPVVAIPVAGDQIHNAKLLERIESGVCLSKDDFNRPDVIADALQKVLYDKSYINNARRTAEMLADKPFSPEELLVKNVEFAAKFGPLTQLDPFGRQLSFIQYHMLDVIAAIVTTLVVILVTVFLVLRSLYRCLFSAKKVKAE